MHKLFKLNFIQNSARVAPFDYFFIYEVYLNTWWSRYYEIDILNSGFCFLRKRKFVFCQVNGNTFKLCASERHVSVFCAWWLEFTSSRSVSGITLYFLKCAVYWLLRLLKLRQRWCFDANRQASDHSPGIENRHMAVEDNVFFMLWQLGLFFLTNNSLKST